MTRLIQQPRVEVSAIIKLTEVELRALEALVGYGTDPFLKVFYEVMGKHYLQPHEAGIRSLFDVIKSDLNPILDRADAAKKAFALHDPVIRSRKDHDALVERIIEQSKAPAKVADAPNTPMAMTDQEAADLMPTNTSMSRHDAMMWIIRATERKYGITPQEASTTKAQHEQT